MKTKLKPFQINCIDLLTQETAKVFARAIIDDKTEYKFVGKYKLETNQLIQREVSLYLLSKFSHDASGEWRKDLGLTTDEALVDYYLD